MTTVSYPAVGNDGFNEAQWAESYSDQDGIVNDYTGLSCVMTRNSTTNIATIAPGIVSVNGYRLKITAAEDLAVPTTAATYYIAAKYDPALNIADGSGDADPAGPCRLVITAGAPSIAGGESYTLLYTIIRAASQALASAPWVDYRRWIGPNVTCNVLPPGEKAFPRVAVRGFGPFPVGTSLLESTTGNRYQFFSPNESLEWVSITNTTPAAFPLAAGMVAFDTAVPEYIVNNGRCYLQGDIKRSNGAALVSATSSTDVLLGTLPFGPAHIRRFNCYGTAQTSAFLKVETNGQVSLYAGGQNITYVDLSNINFQIGA